VTLIQPQYKGGAFKGLARAHCLSCMDGQEYDLRVPANRRKVLKRVILPKTSVQVVAQPLRPFGWGDGFSL